MQKPIIKLLRSVHSRRQVAVTSRATDHLVCTGWATSCKWLCMYWGIFVKIFVSITEFCRCNKSHKLCLIWFFATCCRDKDFHKNSPVHMYTSRHVIATCCPVCTDLFCTIYKCIIAIVLESECNSYTCKSFMKLAPGHRSVWFVWKTERFLIQRRAKVSLSC